MPRVFISYSWDSDEHKDRVRALATHLRKNGIDARLDQWEEGTPPDGWPACGGAYELAAGPPLLHNAMRWQEYYGVLWSTMGGTQRSPHDAAGIFRRGHGPLQ
jgi:hypothetical protein